MDRNQTRFILLSAAACAALMATPVEASYLRRDPAPPEQSRGKEAKTEEGKKQQPKPAKEASHPNRPQNQGNQGRQPPQPGKYSGPPVRQAPPPPPPSRAGRPHSGGPVYGAQPPPPPSRPHSSGPVYGAQPPPPRHSGPHSHRCCPPPPAHGYVYTSPPPPAVHVYDPPQSASGLQRFELHASAQPSTSGALLGVGLLMDGNRLGVDVRYDHLLSASGAGQVNSTLLLDASLTGALFASERTRLRAHLGISSAYSQDVIFVGPSAGLSASAQLLGPLTFDTGAQLVLVPFTRVDARAGLGLRLGVVELRGGMRMLALDDQGRAEGGRKTQLMAGPYLALALVL